MKRREFRLSPATLLLLGLFLIFSDSVNLFSIENSEYTIKAWMIEDGLPQNSVMTLLQSRSGHLWLGTQLGLISFNGLTFPVFNIWNTPGLKSNRINLVYEDAKKRLWVATDGGGVTMVEQDRWTSYQTHEGLNSDRVNAIIEYPRGTLCIGTSRGLNTIRNGKINKIRTGKPIDQAVIQAMAVDGKDNLWIGTDQGLYKKKGLSDADKIEPEIILDRAISALFQDQDGNLWIGTQGGIRLFANGRISTPFPDRKILNELPVTCLYRDRNRALWIGTYGEGLFRMINGELTRYDTASGLSDDFIHAITQDNDLNIWVGTFTGGLIRLKPRIISNITRESGLPGIPVTAVLQDRKGFLWIGTRHRGLGQFKAGRLIKSLSRAQGLLSDRILALCESGNGDIWIGSESGGLNRIRSGNIRSYTREDGLLSDTVNAILQDQSGILWIASTGGLNTFINDTFKVREEFRGIEVNTLFEDRNGALWIGSQRGLSRIQHGRVRHFHRENNSTTYEVFCIFESPHQPGVIWIGTNGTGLLRYEKDRFVQYTKKTGLHSNFVFSITETRKHGRRYLWMSSFTGIFRASLRSLTRFARNETDFITSTFFNEADGMVNSECTGGGFPPVWKTENDIIYVPTIKGLAVLNPNSIQERKPDVPIIIEDFIVDNKSYIHQEDVRLESGRNMFEFYFTALNFSSPQNIKFRYRLEGFEDKWTNLGQNQKRTALYLNLAPGSYHLGQWNEKGIALPFRIRSDFKESLLVYVPRIIILLSFMVGFLLWKRCRSKPVAKTRKYQTSALTPERSREIQRKLSNIMEEEDLYLDPDLTLKKLAEKIHSHPNHISQIVNETFKQSFNDYINHFRIIKAKEKLLDPREREKTILEIAYDVGFYSKSVFNTAFKKFTGVTPSQFKQRQK